MGRLEEIIMPKINDINQRNILILKGKIPLLNDLALVDVSNCLRGTPDRLPRAMREVSHKLSCGVKPGVRGCRFLRSSAHNVPMPSDNSPIISSTFNAKS